MLSARSAVVLVALLAATIGCRVGPNPLDYCGPVYCGGTHPPCAQDVRAGSILSPPVGPMMRPLPGQDDVVPETDSRQAEPTPAPPRQSEPAPQPQPQPHPESQSPWHAAIGFAVAVDSGAVAAPGMATGLQ